MRDDDRDIEELDRLLGGTKAAYRALRHEGDLRLDRPRPVRGWHAGHYAVAATVLVAVLGTAAVFTPVMMGRGETPYRFAMPAPATAPLSFRPETKSRPALSGDRSRMAVRSRLPARPAKTRG